MAIATEQELQAARLSARDSLLSYVISMMPRYDVGAHHLVLMDALEAVERGEIKRLMVTMPPRHGKSELCSRRFPAWYLGRNPEHEVMVSSYGADLAYDFSRAIREQFRDPDWPFGIELKKGEQAVKQWKIEDHNGGVVAAGVGGALTGKGAHVLIIDDPVKDQKDADSPTKRETVWDWYRSVAYTRLSPGGAVIVIQTRWHQGDLSGMLLEEMKGEGEQWVLLEMPALAFGPEELAPGESDPLGRKPGQSLWPSRFSIERLRAIKATVGQRTWSALYQQRPVTGQGAVFKRSWFGNRYKYLNELSLNRIAIVVDAAFKEGVTSSFTSVAVWGQTDTHLALLDVNRAQVGWDEMVSMVKDTWNHWRIQVPSLVPLVIVEDKASGQSLVQHLNSKTEIPCQPFPDKEDQAQKKLAAASKEARADQATPPFAGQKVLLPESAHWLDAWIREHLEFPTGIHDDQVDTTSMAVAFLYGTPVPAFVASVNKGDQYRQGKGGEKRFRDSGYNADRGGFMNQGIRRRVAEETGYNSRRGKLMG